MINKKSLWFLTLFSLILVLSIYYITMPSELLLTTNSSNDIDTGTSTPTVSIEESDLLVSLRVNSDEEMKKEIDELQSILTKNDSTTEEKNNAYEKIKELNDCRSKEEKLENQIETTYNLNSYIKINGDKISVTVDSTEHNNTIANNIMRTIQSNFEDSKYITVKFQE